MGRISTISFPGLGIGEFTIDGVALSFNIGDFPVTVMWYGIIICIGIFAGFGYFAYRARKVWISFDDILDITLVTVITAVIGARLYFVIFFGGFLETGGTFWENLGGTLYNIVAIWNGGLAIYGGIIGGALAVYLMSRRKKIGFFKLTDMIVPGVMLGQIIGRWGNFCNGEAFGSETTLPWRMGLCNYETNYQMIYVHPTFLYESLWNLVGFILINVFYKKRKYHGEVTMWYFAWYGLGRAFIELLRTDSLMLGSVRVSSLLSFVLVVVIVPFAFLLRSRYKKLSAAGVIEMGEIVTIPALLGSSENAAQSAEPTEETAEPDASGPAPQENAQEAPQSDPDAGEGGTAEISGGPGTGAGDMPAPAAPEPEEKSETDVPLETDGPDAEEKSEDGTDH
jgi:prolipoprotein diacylglyceryl transferase